ERRLPERALVRHVLDAEAGAVRQARARELHTPLVLLVRRHEQATARGIELVLHARSVELRRDLADVPLAQSRIERRVVAALRPEHEGHAGGDGRRETDQQQNLFHGGSLASVILRRVTRLPYITH